MLCTNLKFAHVIFLDVQTTQVQCRQSDGWKTDHEHSRDIIVKRFCSRIQSSSITYEKK